MLLPMLSFAKTTANGDILAAPLEQFNNGPGIDPSWDKKANDRMVWVSPDFLRLFADTT